MLREPFTLLSWQHFLSIALGFIISFLIYKITFRGKNPFKSYGLAIFSLWMGWWIVRIMYFGMEAFWTMLPLHLCDITLFISFIAVYFKKKSLYPLIVFTAVGAALALLTPTSTGTSGILTVMTFFFYVTHATNFVAIYVLHNKLGVQIEKGQWLKSAIIVIIIGLVMLIINPILNSNYFYVTEPIDNPLVNKMGDWPIYLIYFIALALSLFFLLEKIILLVRKK